MHVGEFQGNEITNNYLTERCDVSFPILRVLRGKGYSYTQRSTRWQMCPISLCGRVSSGEVSSLSVVSTTSSVCRPLRWQKNLRQKQIDRYRFRHPGSKRRFISSRDSRKFFIHIKSLQKLVKILIRRYDLTNKKITGASWYVRGVTVTVYPT